jgi:hypothetical protein
MLFAASGCWHWYCIKSIIYENFLAFYPENPGWQEICGFDPALHGKLADPRK